MNDDRAGRIGQLIATVRIPVPWDVEQLCENVAQVVGRPVHLHTRSPKAADRIYATVLAFPHAYYLFVRDDLRGVHRDQAICHELGHLLAGHLNDVQDEAVPASLTSMLPSLSPALIGRVLNRECCYDVEREQDAEMIGTGLLTRGRDQSDSSGTSIAQGFGEALL